MKRLTRIFASITLAAALAFSGTAQATGLVQPASAPATERLYTPAPNAPKSPLQRFRDQRAQAIGYVCRNGYYWCQPGGWGYVGSPCCCPNFCGWVSNW